VVLNTDFHLAPKLNTEQSYTSTSPLGLRDLLKGEIYLFPFYATYIGSCPLFGTTYRTLHQVSNSIPVLRNEDGTDRLSRNFGA